MVLWAWDADPDFGEVAGEQWLALLPRKWNPSKALLYGWRYDPREFAAAPTGRDERRRRRGEPHVRPSDAHVLVQLYM